MIMTARMMQVEAAFTLRKKQTTTHTAHEEEEQKVQPKRRWIRPGAPVWWWWGQQIKSPCSLIEIFDLFCHLRNVSSFPRSFFLCPVRPAKLSTVFLPLSHSPVRHSSARRCSGTEIGIRVGISDVQKTQSMATGFDQKTTPFMMED